MDSKMEKKYKKQKKENEDMFSNNIEQHENVLSVIFSV